MERHFLPLINMVLELNLINQRLCELPGYWFAKRKRRKGMSDVIRYRVNSKYREVSVKLAESSIVDVARERQYLMRRKLYLESQISSACQVVNGLIVGGNHCTINGGDFTSKRVGLYDSKFLKRLFHRLCLRPISTCIIIMVFG